MLASTVQFSNNDQSPTRHVDSGLTRVREIPVAEQRPAMW
jgi:hypothetical protein